MIETHCHLTDPVLGNQLADVLARAKAAGVTQLVTIATSINDSHAAVALANRHGHLGCTVGIHPNHSATAAAEDVRDLAGLVDQPAVVAVGECGLDYFHSHADRKHQATVFIAQLELARQSGLPAVIHSRDAIADTLAILKTFPDVACVFHCFTGTMDEARQILDAGHLLGFTGPVTYKKNDELRSIAAMVPADRLLVETDAPYLSPEPVRGQRPCEPAMVMHVARRVSEVRGISLDQLDELTTANAHRFFRGLAARQQV